MNAMRGFWRRGLQALAAAAVGLASLNVSLQAGTFSFTTLTGDADSGLSTGKTYSHAVSLVGNAATANGVAFEAASAAGTNWTFNGPSFFTGDSGPGNVTGAIGDVLRRFQYGNGTVTLGGLIPGQPYVTTWYSKGWEAAGRVVNITASDGGSTTFDQDVYGQNNGSLLQYSFIAPPGGSIAYGFTGVTAASFHMYGFTNELAATPANQWALATGGSWNQTSSWTAGTIPNGAGAEAWLTQQTAAQADVSIDSPVTAGKIYVDNSSGYRTVGASTLSLQGSGGHALVAVQQGTFRLAGSTNLAGDVDVSIAGASAMYLDGALSGSGQIFKSGLGTLYGNVAQPGYSGQVNVLQASARMGNPQGLGTGALRMAGGNLILWWNGGSNVVNNPIILDGLGTHDGKAAIYADGGGAGYSEYVLAGPVTLASTSNVGGNNVNHLRITGQISGPGGLTKGGTRTDENNNLILTNPANDYAGNTTVTKGQLVLGSSEVIPHGPGKGGVIVNPGATLVVGYDETINSLSGTGTVQFTGAPTGPVYFNTDAGSDISAAKTYTHLLDFNAAWGSSPAVAVVNGVTFTSAGTSGANWSGVPGNNTGNTATGMTDNGGMHELFKDFYYNGNPAVVTLSGLTPGATYETRLYNRRWGGDRTQLFTFDEDGAGPASSTLIFNEDASATPGYVGYRFTALSSSLTLTVKPQPGAGTYHWYGLSNEEIAPYAVPALTVGDAADSTFSGTITGAGKLVKQGSGQLLLSSASSYTGGTDIAAGRLRIGNPGGLGSGPVSLSGGSLLLWWNGGSNEVANDFVLNGVVANDGKAAIYADGGGAGFGEYVLSGDITLASTSNIGGHNINHIRHTGRITGPGGLVKGGTRGDESNTLILAGDVSNDYQGDTTLLKGTLTLAKTGGAVAIPGNLTLGNGSSGNSLWLRMEGANQFAPDSVVTFNNGTTNAKFQLNGFSQTLGGLASSGSLAIVQNAETEATGIGPATLTLDVAGGAEHTFAGYLRDRAGGNAGRLGIEKRGPGTQVFGGGNIGYTGQTHIYEGALRITSNNGLGAGGHDGNTMTWVHDGGALELAGGVTSNEHMHFAGHGVGGTGAIRSLGGDNVFTDRHAMDAHSTIGVDSGSLSFNNWNGSSEGGIYESGGSWSLTKVGAGSLIMNVPATYSGGTILKGGTYSVGDDRGLGKPAPLTFDGGSLQARASFTLDPRRTVSIQGGGGTFDVAAGASLYVGQPISGSGSLAKTGQGVLELAGHNTYGGATDIRQGTVRLVPTPASALAAHYTFDAGSAADSSPNALHGVVGSSVTPSAGIVDGALNFPLVAGTGHVTVGYSSLFDVNAFTVSAWVYPTDKNGSRGILGTRIGGDTTFDVKVRAGDIHGDVGNGSAWITTGLDIRSTDTGTNGQGGNLPVNQWSLVTYVLDGANAYLYVDGDLKRTMGVAGPRLMKPGQQLWIGDDYAGNEPFAGRIDDVYIFGRGLSGLEVLQLFQRGLAGGQPEIIPSLSPVTVSAGATLDLNGVPQTLGSLAGDGDVLLGGSALRVGANSGDAVFGGTIWQGGSVAKIGGGAWTVHGTIHAPVTVEDGRLGGNGTVDGPLTILAGAEVSAGASAGHLSVAGEYLQAGTMLAELDGPLQGVSYDWIDVLGTATLEQDSVIRVLLGYDVGHGTTFDILTAANGITNVDLGGIVFDYTQAQGDLITWRAEIVDLDGTAGSAEALRLTAVPEPLSATLLLLGAAAAGMRTRRRVRAA